MVRAWRSPLRHIKVERICATLMEFIKVYMCARMMITLCVAAYICGMRWCGWTRAREHVPKSSLHINVKSCMCGVSTSQSKKNIARRVFSFCPKSIRATAAMSNIIFCGISFWFRLFIYFRFCLWALVCFRSLHLRRRRRAPYSAHVVFLRNAWIILK